MTHATPSPRPAPRRLATALLQAAALVAAIAVLDWLVSDAVPLGWLYLAPMALAATVFNPWAILLLACACTFLAECFDGYPWDLVSGIPRDLLYLSAFSGSALFVHITMRSRRTAAQHLHLLEEQMNARQDAEEQLRVLVENSPVAVFTANAASIVLLANAAADTLFALDRGSLAGQSFAPYLPLLLELPTLQAPLPGAPSPGTRLFRTAMQCRGHRANGEIFQADVWFSTYGTTTGPRLAVFVADSSEDLRDREEASLHQLLTGSRILVGAVSHEVRNVCAAIAVVHENLRRASLDSSFNPGLNTGALRHSKDFEALGTLVLALERIASVELREAANQLAAIDLRSLLEEVQIVIGSTLREDEITLLWDIPRTLPPVWADRQSLFQVLLNLVKNSQHALERTPGNTVTPEAAPDSENLPGPDFVGAPPPPPPTPSERSIRLSVLHHDDRVSIVLADTGPGVPYPEFLFKPFQQQARAAGLGLYLSRALMRSFSGDLRYQPPIADAPGATFPGATFPGATFIVELATAPHGENHA